MLGADPGLAALKTVLVERTDGNPLFLEESVRALVETQALIGEPGARRLVKPLETVQVPGSVQAVLAARIDRLTPAAKHVLQSASVIGKDVPFPVLAEIADLPDEGLRAGLALLQSGEMLYEASFVPEIEYTFKHALTHEVATAARFTRPGARCTRASWTPSSGSTPGASASTWSGWPTTPCVAAGATGR
jgi:predicted ATPase